MEGFHFLFSLLFPIPTQQGGITRRGIHQDKTSQLFAFNSFQPNRCHGKRQGIRVLALAWHQLWCSVWKSAFWILALPLHDDQATWKITNHSYPCLLSPRWEPAHLGTFPWRMCRGMSLLLFKDSPWPHPLPPSPWPCFIFHLVSISSIVPSLSLSLLNHH